VEEKMMKEKKRVGGGGGGVGVSFLKLPIPPINTFYEEDS